MGYIIKFKNLKPLQCPSKLFNFKVSSDGVPLLVIDFHDGKPYDVAELKQFNPIPRMKHEAEESIDNCIFQGRLRDEPKVFVTLTGGCPFDTSFEVYEKRIKKRKEVPKLL